MSLSQKENKSTHKEASPCRKFIRCQSKVSNEGSVKKAEEDLINYVIGEFQKDPSNLAHSFIDIPLDILIRVLSMKNIVLKSFQDIVENPLQENNMPQHVVQEITFHGFKALDKPFLLDCISIY